MKATSKMEGTKKGEDDLRNEECIKNEDDNLKNWFPPCPLKNYLKVLLMTSHHDIHTKIDVKLEVIPGILTKNGIPHDKCNLRGIAYALCTHKQKDNIFMQRLYIDKAHMALDIFRFAAFLFDVS